MRLSPLLNSISRSKSDELSSSRWRSSAADVCQPCALPAPHRVHFSSKTVDLLDIALTPSCRGASLNSDLLIVFSGAGALVARTRSFRQGWTASLHIQHPLFNRHRSWSWQLRWAMSFLFNLGAPWQSTRQNLTYCRLSGSAVICLPDGVTMMCALSSSSLQSLAPDLSVAARVNTCTLRRASRLG